MNVVCPNGAPGPCDSFTGCDNAPQMMCETDDDCPTGGICTGKLIPFSPPFPPVPRRDPATATACHATTRETVTPSARPDKRRDRGAADLFPSLVTHNPGTVDHGRALSRAVDEEGRPASAFPFAVGRRAAVARNYSELNSSRSRTPERAHSRTIVVRSGPLSHYHRSQSGKTRRGRNAVTIRKHSTTVRFRILGEGPNFPNRNRVSRVLAGACKLAKYPGRGESEKLRARVDFDQFRFPDRNRFDRCQ